MHYELCIVHSALCIIKKQGTPKNALYVYVLIYQKIPCDIIASATLRKPAMFAPATRL